MTKVELGKQYKLRNGAEARVYAVDGSGDYPVHGAYVNEHGLVMMSWREDGRCWRSGHSRDEPYDLVEVKPRIKREVWVNVYDSFRDMFFDCRASKAEADLIGGQRIACVKVVIDCEEGEGL